MHTHVDTALPSPRLWSALDILLVPVIAFIVVTNRREVIDLNALLLCVSVPYAIRSILRRRRRCLNFNLIDVSVVAVVSTELIGYFTSSYRANSFYYLAEVLFLFLFFLLVRHGLSHDYQRIAVFALLSLWAGALSQGAIFDFIARFQRLTALGFTDVTNFKQQFSFFTPPGLIAGEWLTIYLVLLAFPLILLLHDQTPLLLKALLALCTVLIVITLLLTLSRGVYAALLCFCLTAGGLLYAHRLVRLKHLAVFLGLTGLLTALMLIPFRQPVLTTAALFKTTSQVRSVEGRNRVWNHSVQLFRENPALGAGAYNFPLRYMSIKARADDSVFAVSPFNFFLQVLVEKGLAGLAAYVLLALSFFVVSFRAVRSSRSRLQKITAVLFIAAYAAALVRDLSYSSILPNTSLSLLLWLMFALNARTADAARPDAPADGSDVTSGWRGVAPPALMTAALILFAGVALRLEKVRQADASFQSFTHNLTEGRLDDARRDIDAALRLSPDNAHFAAYRAVLHTRMLSVAAGPEEILSDGVSYGGEDGGHIEAAVGWYQKALALNPNDDLFHHSLGWLYLMQRDRGKALEHFRRAAEIDTSNALYHVSLGLLYEHLGEQENGRREYTTAVRLSPSLLDSRFFAGLTRRAPAAAERVVADTMQQLEAEGRRRNSPFVKGKLGYLYLFKNQVGRAKALLAEAASELPSLPGPWFNLGYVYELEGNEEGMYECYVKATFIYPKDVQPWIRLGDFHYRRYHAAEAVNAYQQGIRNWVTQPSERVQQARRVYHSYPNLPLANSIVPETLSAYCRPGFPVASTFGRMAELYKDLNNPSMSEYYEQKAREHRQAR